MIDYSNVYASYSIQFCIRSDVGEMVNSTLKMFLFKTFVVIDLLDTNTIYVLKAVIFNNTLPLHIPSYSINWTTSDQSYIINLLNLTDRFIVFLNILNART